MDLKAKKRPLISMIIVGFLLFTTAEIVLLYPKMDRTTAICGIIILPTVSLFILWGEFSTYLELEDTYLGIRSLWIKRKIAYSDMDSVSPGPIIGSYFLVTTYSKSYYIFMPFEHKKLRLLFDKMRENNNHIKFGMGWYTREK